jgi:8-oxo-dGTP pyrophosphatase MutT (NUDIX family)
MPFRFIDLRMAPPTCGPESTLCQQHFFPQWDCMMAKQPEWLFRQAAALPYLVDDRGVQLVLITSRSSGKWILPKGVVEPAQTPAETARLEAFEEAGVLGQITGPALGFYDHPKPEWGGVAKVEVFPLLVMELLEDWDERTSRRRELVDFLTAMERLAPPIGILLAAYQDLLNTKVEPND